MPLVLDARRHGLATLRRTARSLRSDLLELRASIEHPRGRVRDPSSLRTAEELVEATLRALDRSGARDRARLASDANLAYAVLLAVVDLVKSHTDVPTVPRSSRARANARPTRPRRPSRAG